MPHIAVQETPRAVCVHGLRISFFQKLFWGLLGPLNPNPTPGDPSDKSLTEARERSDARDYFEGDVRHSRNPDEADDPPRFTPRPMDYGESGLHRTILIFLQQAYIRLAAHGS